MTQIDPMLAQDKEWKVVRVEQSGEERILTPIVYECLTQKEAEQRVKLFNSGFNSEGQTYKAVEVKPK